MAKNKPLRRKLKDLILGPHLQELNHPGLMLLVGDDFSF